MKLIAIIILVTLSACAHGPVKHLRSNCTPANEEAKKGQGKGLFYCEDLPERNNVFTERH